MMSDVSEIHIVATSSKYLTPYSRSTVLKKIYIHDFTMIIGREREIEMLSGARRVTHRSRLKLNKNSNIALQRDSLLPRTWNPSSAPLENSSSSSPFLLGFF